MSIISFKNEELELIFKGQDVKGWSYGSIDTTRRRLMTIHSAADFNDFRNLKSLKFQEVKQKVKGYDKSQKLWRVKINLQWSIVFRWKDGDAYDLGIADIH